jgi:hypothetical protein
LAPSQNGGRAPLPEAGGTHPPPPVQAPTIAKFPLCRRGPRCRHLRRNPACSPQIEHYDLIGTRTAFGTIDCDRSYWRAKSQHRFLAEPLRRATAYHHRRRCKLSGCRPDRFAEGGNG